MAVDNLLSAETVLASGEVVTASQDADPDLFWALRGGGGNFGVVTSFEYRAHPVASVLGGPVLHPLAAAPQLFSFYREFAADLPDELSTQAIFLHAPDGSGAKLCGVAVCHAGDDAERAEADVRPLRQFGAPAADMIQRMPYPAMNTGVDWLSPEGVLSYWKSAFFFELSDHAVGVMIKAFERSPSELCALVVEEFHGAVTRVAPTATAYPHREPGFNLLLISSGPTRPDRRGRRVGERDLRRAVPLHGRPLLHELPVGRRLRPRPPAPTAPTTSGSSNSSGATTPTTSSGSTTTSTPGLIRSRPG